MVETADYIWRNFNLDGIPSSGFKKPEKLKIREWGVNVELLQRAVQAGGGIVFTELVHALSHLAYNENQLAWVTNDSNAAQNGVYQKLGASGTGTWIKRANLPYSFGRFTGSGTANAIVATSVSPPSISDDALLAVSVFITNTSDVVTISFDGGTSLQVKTSSGNNPPAGTLIGGMVIAGYKSGGQFRLVSDIASGAILSAVEAAVAIALTYKNLAIAAADLAATVGAGDIPTVPSRAAAVATSFIAARSYLLVNGYAVPGDAPPALYVRVASQPTHKGKFRSTDTFLPNGTTHATNGGWWELSNKGPIFTTHFGAVCDGITDDSAKIQDAVDYCLSFTRPLALYHRGISAATFNVDRAVGTAAAATDFLIVGVDAASGFYANGSVTILNSTLFSGAGNDIPGSCNVNLQSLFFLGGGSADTLAISWRFVRVKALMCRFNVIRVVQSPLYVQSWRFNQCSHLAWTGNSYSCLETYFDCHWEGCDWESGGNGIISFQGVGLNGSSIKSCLFENSGRFFSQVGGDGFDISANYTEANSLPDYTLSQQPLGGKVRGGVFKGNFAALHTHGDFNVVVGEVEGLDAGGNYYDDDLYDVSGTTAGTFKDRGSYAGGEKFSDPSKHCDGDAVGRFFDGSESGATGLTTNDWVAIHTDVLEPGDYDVSSTITFSGFASTNATRFRASISATGVADGSRFAAMPVPGVVFADGDTYTLQMQERFNLAVQTTITVFAKATFTVSLCYAKATLKSRQMG